MYFIYKLPFEVMVKIFLGIFLLTFLFYLLPLILLYLNYLKYNRKSKLVINENEEKSLVTFSFQDSETTFSSSEIKKIKIHLSFPLYNKRMRWFFWDELFYYEIILNTNKTIFISCLLCDDLSKHFLSTKIERKKRIMPFIQHTHIL